MYGVLVAFFFACSFLNSRSTYPRRLAGDPPFTTTKDVPVYKQIQTAQYDFNADVWKRVSPSGLTCDCYFVVILLSAPDLIRRLLTLDPHHRLTATQILEHPWLKVVISVFVLIT